MKRYIQFPEKKAAKLDVAVMTVLLLAIAGFFVLEALSA